MCVISMFKCSVCQREETDRVKVESGADLLRKIFTREQTFRDDNETITRRSLTPLLLSLVKSINVGNDS